MSRHVNIVGVDFSGAAPDNNTWMSQARLSGVRLDQLELTDCRRVSRGQVANELEGSPGGTVASLDFPFSVPRDFAEFWMPQAQSMPELWAGAARMDFPAFMALRDAFVAVHGESKRVCDRAFPECYSCLHKVNPNMVPMTFRGMQMLDRLWSWGCAVPPLAPQEAGKPGPPAPPVLLEAMPGAALKAMNLPYKGYKNGVNALALRQRILDGLPERSGLGMPNLDGFKEQCMVSHDCLDSVIAAVTAALWARQPDLFWRPEDSESSPVRVSLKKSGRRTKTAGVPPDDGKSRLESAKLEGWLYAPVNI